MRIVVLVLVLLGSIVSSVKKKYRSSKYLRPVRLGMVRTTRDPILKSLSRHNMVRITSLGWPVPSLEKKQAAEIEGHV